MNAIFLPTPMGGIQIVASKAAIHSVFYIPSSNAECETAPSTPLLRWAVEELQAYFAGRLTQFTVPLQPEGTPFQRRVWSALRQIPYGTTATYGEIARQIGQPKAARAVGRACHTNPIAILIPCHRVIGATGALTGYAGGLSIKRALLEHERAGFKAEPQRLYVSPSGVSGV